MRCLGLALLVTCLGLACANESGFSSLIATLSRFQNPDGGFRTSFDLTEQSSLEATSQALFLSSLYGLNTQINTTEASKYVLDRENSDGGFGKHVALASDLQSVRHALTSFQHLGAAIPTNGKTAAFVLALYDAESGLFRNRADEKPDLKSTAAALEALNILSELQRWGENNLSKVRKYLDKHIISEPKAKTVQFSFPEEESLSPVSANYYGLVIGSLVNFEFKNPAQWVKYITIQQSREGGVYADAKGETTSIESTAHAALSLRILGSAESFADQTGLLKFLQDTPRDFGSVSLAHLAVASTKSFTDNLKTALSYETADHAAIVSDEFVQGSKIRPILTVTTFQDVAHAGLEVDLEAVFPDGSKQSAKMLWSAEKRHYSADAVLDTKGQLGEIKLDYILRCIVPALGGVISFEVKDVKRTGYKVSIDAAANHGGKSVSVGDKVGIHTAFSFNVKLSNTTHDDLRSGNFKIFFKVADSSNIEFHTATIDASANSKSDAISFSYTLADGKLPSGHLSFVIDVADAKSVHTHHVTTYELVLPMIATDINFAQDSFKIGDKVSVTFIPASLDSRAASTYTAGSSQSLASRRAFFLDITSAGGVVLESIKGVAQSTPNGASKYLFETSVKPQLQSIGTNIVSFRYRPASGPDVVLTNYDLQQMVALEEPLQWKVDAELRVVKLPSNPVPSKLQYGNEISFKFGIVDSVTKKSIVPSSSELANFFLVVQHKDSTRAQPLITSRHPASHADDSFSIDWSVNANAMPGDGALVLVAQDADGKQLRLWREKGDEPVAFNIHVGGEIKVNQRAVYSSSHPSQHSASFLVEFDLSCDDKSLPGASLRASVLRKSGSTWTIVNGLSDLRVASNAGSYQLSWILPFAEAPSGEYKVAFFRETEGEEIPAFIEVLLHHESHQSALSFNIKFDLIALISFFAASFYISQHKTELLSTKPRKSK